MTTLSVMAIKNGSVIDHIPVGQAVAIIRLLQLNDTAHQMTLGLNLHSVGMGLKDLIKIENRVLSEREIEQISVLAPHATINIIIDFKVAKKIKVKLPQTIRGLLRCPNLACITRHEKVESFFSLVPDKENLKLTCYYCEKSFTRTDMREYIKHD